MGTGWKFAVTLDFFLSTHIACLYARVSNSSLACRGQHTLAIRRRFGSPCSPSFSIDPSSLVKIGPGRAGGIGEPLALILPKILGGGLDSGGGWV